MVINKIINLLITFTLVVLISCKTTENTPVLKFSIPDISGFTIHKDFVRISELKTSFILLVFIPDDGCILCFDEIKQWNELAEIDRNRLQIIGIISDSDNELIKTRLKKCEFPILIDNGEIMHQFGISNSIMKILVSKPNFAINYIQFGSPHPSNQIRNREIIEKIVFNR